MAVRRKRRGLKAALVVVPAALAVPAVVRALDARRSRDDGDVGVAFEAEELEAVSADGTRISVRAAGDGDTVVFLVHGWTCRESVFRYQQNHLRGRYRVVSFDQRGHGMSGMPPDLDYHPDRLAEDIKAVVDLVAPERFVVAGHSMGGFASFKFYERFGSGYGGRLKGMAIIDSTGTDLLEGIVFGKLLRRVPEGLLGRLLTSAARLSAPANRVLRLVGDTAVAYLVVRWAAFGRKPCGAHVEHLREMVTRTPFTSLVLAAKACLDFRFEHYLGLVRVPVLLLVGDRDKLTDLESNEKTARLLPDSRLRVFPGAGHCTLLERREEFNDELDRFLEEVF